MRATPPARALAWSLDVLDRFWGPVVLVVVVVLEVAVFGPRQLTLAMIMSGIVGAAAMVVWLFGPGR